MAKKPNYTERIQVYLHPKAEQDRIVHDVYKAFGMEGRGAEAMRMILRAGVKACFENGDLPQSVIDRCRLDERLASRRGVAQQVVYAPPMMPAAPIIPYDEPRRQTFYEQAPAARSPVIDQAREAPPREPEPPKSNPKPAPQAATAPPGDGNLPKSKLLNLMT